MPLALCDYYAEMDIKAYQNETPSPPLTQIEAAEKNKCFKYETYIDECCDAYCDANEQEFSQTVNTENRTPQTHGLNRMFLNQWYPK